MEENKGRTLIVGDVHGTWLELQELLEKVKYQPKIDRLIGCGDLLDRGPDSVKVVQFFRENDLECVMGNHENKFLRWWKGNHHYDAPAHYPQFTDEDVAYINRMPYYLKLRDDLYVVHAGVKPGIPIEQQDKNDLMYLRFTDDERKMISLRKVAKGKAPGAKFWTEFYNGPYSIVYGHNVHSLLEPRIDEVAPGVKCFGIDLGACFGGFLAMLIVETGEIVKVKAHKTHYKYDE